MNRPLVHFFALLATVVVLLTICKTTYAGQPVIRIFILAGQSNMEGHGNQTTLDVMLADPENAALLNQIRKKDGSYVVRNDVFTYYKRNGSLIKAPLQFGQGVQKDFMGPEMGFGTVMGEYFTDPVLLIKTAWGGKDLYCDYRPPSAGKPAYTIPGEPREVGAYYRQMIREVHECLNQIEKNFPQLKGMPYSLSGFVWVQGWNDFYAPREIQKQVFDEYASNFSSLVHDLRAEMKSPRLPVVVAEQGCGGEKADANMIRFRAAQAKMLSAPELAGTLGYVRTAPFWYDDLNELPRKLWAQSEKIKKANNLPERELTKALEANADYQKLKIEHDKHIGHWECHYQGSSRIYMHIGVSLAEAMKALLKSK